MEVFAWTGSGKTVVSQFVMEHQLKIYPHVEPMTHKRRPIVPEGRVALKEKVFRWLKEGLIRKEYSQIRMAEDDEEKIGFHTEEGVYCFTHMPKELKNSAVTLQRMMEKVLVDQRGQNMEIYLEEVVIKSKSLNEVGDNKRNWLDKRSRRSPPKDKKETREVANIGRPKRRRRSNAMSMTKKRDNKLCATGREERSPDTYFLLKWAAEIRTYDISYIPRKEAKGSVVKKFSSQGEQVQETLDENEGGTLNLNKELQAKSTLTPRAWRLYLGKETIEEDCEALLAGLAASANQGLTTIKLEFLNQEVSVGIKTRPSVEETSSSKKRKAASNAPGEKPNYNCEARGSN
ncbi:reverse transcriptase domain-containing protein [Tanacetum coccineum]